MWRNCMEHSIVFGCWHWNLCKLHWRYFHIIPGSIDFPMYTRRDRTIVRASRFYSLRWFWFCFLFDFFFLCTMLSSVWVLFCLCIYFIVQVFLLFLFCFQLFCKEREKKNNANRGKWSLWLFVRLFYLIKFYFYGFFVLCCRKWCFYIVSCMYFYNSIYQFVGFRYPLKNAE